MDNHESSSQKMNFHEHQSTVSSFQSSSSDINSYFHKQSNPNRIRQKIDEISMDQIETWAHIKRLEQKIEKARKRMKKRPSISSSAHAVTHEKNIEELIDAVSKDEANSKLQRDLH